MFYIEFNTHLKHPFTCLVFGPTGAGKTEFIKKLLYNRMIDPMPHRLVWFYGKWQNTYNEIKYTTGIPKIEFYEGINKDIKFNKKENNLLIIDDLMNNALDDPWISDIYTKGSHHDNVSIILLVQNLFSRAKNSRTISVNAHYIFVFKNPRDQLQISTLARQMYGAKNWRLLQEAYDHATKKPYSYLMIDLRQTTPDCMRLRSSILPNEKTKVYISLQAYKSLKQKQ